MKDIEKLVMDLLVDICGTRKIKNDIDIDLIELGYLDSMGLIEVITFLEDEFNVEIPLASFSPKNFSTARKITELVKENIARLSN